MSIANPFGKMFLRRSDAAESGADGPDNYMPHAYAMDAMYTAQSGGAGLDYGDDIESEFTVFPLGKATAAQHQKKLLMMLAVGLVVLALLAAWVLQQADRSAKQLAATGQSLMQAQRLAKSVSLAMIGNLEAFGEVRESSGVLASNVRALTAGDESLGVQPLAETHAEAMARVTPLSDRTERNAQVVLGQERVLVQVGAALQNINRISGEVTETAEHVALTKLQQSAPAPEVAAANQLMMLTQRIGKSANGFQTLDGVNPEAVFMLGKDLNTFKELTTGLLDGSAELRLSAAKDGASRAQLSELVRQYEKLQTLANTILGNLKGLASAREAQAAIVKDSEPLRGQLEALQTQLSNYSGVTLVQLALLVAISISVLGCGVGIARVQLLDSRARQRLAEQQQREARRKEQEAKRLNDANQAAILRLMNELQSVAEGDLTQEATVTEDITGAIADSVNYTVEELRQLVGSVHNTVNRVAQTTANVENTSTHLLAKATEQLREIRETGQSVLDMAGRINVVSTQAQESASVARQSLKAADTGLQAVQNTIGGMNAIRDQIQETSKRIKRLGESSQEIGEITELISDITEQTNVLALNAAIQAASAGEAGRGFSVVAEEVQRLAERSADATRQIASLVQAIQTDTQDAVAAMERSTRGVVEGARLSDSAGTALSEIDRVSRRLAELIEVISKSTQREAELANVVAGNIQHIFAVTEQTGQGTRMTAQQVRELSRMADELRQSVSRFKIA